MSFSHCRSVIEHVAQRALQLEVDAVLVGPAQQGFEHVAQGFGRPLEVDDLARELVDALREIRAALAEQLVLDLVDVVLQAAGHGVVLVDDLVEDRVEHRLGTAREQVGVLLESPPHLREVGNLGVTHGHDVVGADEDVELAELHRLGLVDVARGSEYREEVAPVALELRALVPARASSTASGCSENSAATRSSSSGEGRNRPIHASAVGLHVLEGLVEAGRVLDAVTVDVHGAVDDGHESVVPRMPMRAGPVAPTLTMSLRGHFFGSLPQFMSEYRQSVSVMSPFGFCALCRLT